MIAYLSYSLLIGLTAASLVTVFRAVPPGKTLAATGRKPWACDQCMSFWTTILVALGAGATLIPWSDTWTALPAFMVCLWFLKQTKDFPIGEMEDDPDHKI